MLAMSLAMSVSAQNFKNDGKEYEVYCMVKHYTYGNKVYVNVGEKRYHIAGYDSKHGELTEVLNLLAKRGWVMVCCYGTEQSTGSKQCYVMKKVIKDDKEAEEGLEIAK